MASDQKSKVRVAIAGVGNCASSLVQGVSYYSLARDAREKIPGLMHTQLGGYFPGDIEFSAAFDVADGKVGEDLSDAIYSSPNNTFIFDDSVPNLGVKVERGPVMDGVGKYLGEHIKIASAAEANVVNSLRDSGTDVLVNYLPVGSEDAARFYAGAALKAGCGFVNCIPVFIASSKTGDWDAMFAEKGLPLIGDDIKSQVGATITHRVLTHLFEERGVRLDKTYQLNVGGNMDFCNMLERSRLESKKISKTQAVQAELGTALDPEDIHVGPSDYVPWLGDRKFAFIRMEGTTFGDVPLMAELKLEVWDSPNSAGVVIDAVRCAKAALNMGIGGVLDAPSAYFMKSPRRQVTDEKAREELDRFIMAANTVDISHA